jgi:hypothetical protein
MKPKVRFLALFMVCILCLPGCRAARSIKPGYYTGVNPEVSFNLSASGVENFIIKIKPIQEGSASGTHLETCQYQHGFPLPIALDKTFGYTIGENPETFRLTGKVNGSTVSGTYYTFDCVLGQKIQGEWSASRQGALKPTATSWPMPTVASFQGLVETLETLGFESHPEYNQTSGPYHGYVYRYGTKGSTPGEYMEAFVSDDGTFSLWMSVPDYQTDNHKNDPYAFTLAKLFTPDVADRATSAALDILENKDGKGENSKDVREGGYFILVIVINQYIQTVVSPIIE